MFSQKVNHPRSAKEFNSVTAHFIKSKKLYKTRVLLLQVIDWSKTILSNEVEHVHLWMIELKHHIYGFEQTDIEH